MVNRGHRVEKKTSSYATVQGILRDGNDIFAHSDSRKGGKAVVIY